MHKHATPESRDVLQTKNLVLVLETVVVDNNPVPDDVLMERGEIPVVQMHKSSSPDHVIMTNAVLDQY